MMHKKIAFIFIGLTGLALILIVIALGASFCKATILITPKISEINVSPVIKITKTGEQGSLAGQVSEYIVEKEKEFVVPGSKKVEGNARGKVTIINDYVKPQTLVRTTRLLSEEGVLFRLADKVTVPAGSQVEVEVYADQPGPRGNIGPSRFTIPGLWEGLQKKIYAKSETPMSGGLIYVGAVKQEDIDRAKKEVENEIFDELKKQGLKGQAIQKTILYQDISAKAGDEVGAFKVKMKLRVAAVALNESELLDMTWAELKKQVPENKTLISVVEDSFNYSIEDYNLKQGEARIRTHLTGKLVISATSPIVAPAKLCGLTSQEAVKYLEEFSEIDKAEVKFTPFWLKKIPASEKYIEVIIKTEK